MLVVFSFILAADTKIIFGYDFEGPLSDREFIAAAKKT